MPFSDADYDTEMLALLARALDDAWHRAQPAMGVASPAGEEAARRAMALRIMAVADAGERDHERLVLAALKAVESRLPR